MKMLKRMLTLSAAFVLLTGFAATAHADGILFTKTYPDPADVIITGQKMTPQGVVTKKIRFTKWSEPPEKEKLLGEDYRLSSVKVEFWFGGRRKNGPGRSRTSALI